MRLIDEWRFAFAGVEYVASTAETDPFSQTPPREIDIEMSKLRVQVRAGLREVTR